MTVNQARQTLDRQITEKDFQQSVIDLAQRTGWMVFHPFDMRRSRQGYPDLTMVNPVRGIIVFAELKRENGRLTTDQGDWYQALAVAAGFVNGSDWTVPIDVMESGVYVVVWRPSQWDEIAELLIGEGAE